VNAARKEALRLALYLDCAGVAPILTGRGYKQFRKNLNQQLMALEPELRKQARRKGRKMICVAPGLEEAASHLIPDLSHPPFGREKALSGYERCAQRILLWPPETPPCETCRMWGGFPKKTWGSFEKAEEVRLRQNDSGLRAFECPSQPGSWHLGHVKTNSPLSVGDGRGRG
jgi:hypothetical protein